MKRIWIVFAVLALLAIALPAQSQQLTRVRVAHLSPDAPQVQIYVNGEVGAIQNLSYGQISGWVELVPGTYNIAVAPVGAPIEQAAIGPVDVRLAPGGWYTVSAIGSLASGTLTAAVDQEPYPALEPGEANVTVFHAIEDAPAVDVILPDGTAIVSNLRFGNGATITVPSGVYDLAVVPSGATSPVVINLAGTALNSQTYYFVAAINSLANPGVALTTVNFGQVDSLIGKTLNPRSIVDIAASDSRFDTLVAALQATGLDAALQGPGPFTVFAPTDAAFAALLNDLGLTAEELLANTELVTNVLLYHVAPTRAFAADVVSVNGIGTLLGPGINIGIDDQGPALNFNTRLLQTDIEAGNGVIHVIDRVLLPPQ